MNVLQLERRMQERKKKKKLSKILCLWGVVMSPSCKVLRTGRKEKKKKETAMEKRCLWKNEADRGRLLLLLSGRSWHLLEQHEKTK